MGTSFARVHPRIQTIRWYLMVGALFIALGLVLVSCQKVTTQYADIPEEDVQRPEYTVKMSPVQ